MKELSNDDLLKLYELLKRFISDLEGRKKGVENNDW